MISKPAPEYQLRMLDVVGTSNIIAEKAEQGVFRKMKIWQEIEDSKLALNTETQWEWVEAERVGNSVDKVAADMI